jgi:hypothetical protein
VAWAMVVIGVTQSCVEVTLSNDTREMLGHALFGLATFVTLISALDSILNAKTRWRQLRSCACSLEAIIWCYRARIGRFQQSISENARPEVELCDAINAWRVELMSAADLPTTGMLMKRTHHIYMTHTSHTCMRMNRTHGMTQISHICMRMNCFHVHVTQMPQIWRECPQIWRTSPQIWRACP